MDQVVIQTFASTGDVSVGSADELRIALRTLSDQYQRRPILVSLRSSSQGPMLIGLGTELTTIEILTAKKDRRMRSLASDPGTGTNIVFTYAGEWTEVAPKHLIPFDDGIRAACEWFVDGRLLEAVKWSIIPWPPDRRT